MCVSTGGTQPAQSKNEVFSKPDQHNTWGYLTILIGIFGLYDQLLPLYELDIIPWIYILSKQTKLWVLYQKYYMELIQNLWTPDYQSLL